MRISICREYSFEAAHHLEYHNGKCHNLHGHSYRVEVEVEGELCREGNDTGMVMDFAGLDYFVNSLVINKLDHTVINESLPEIYPTAENIALWVFSELSQSFGLIVRLKRVRVYETARSYAEVVG